MSKSIPVSELRRWLPARKPDSHKGEFGHVLIVAGSRGMSGAAVLAAKAALRAGAGLVTAAVPQSVQPVVAAMLPEALTLGLAETNTGSVFPDAAFQLKVVHEERKFTVLAIGPGLGTHADTARAVLTILQTIKIPSVVDADALNSLALQSLDSIREFLRRRETPCIFTPHPGEAARLLRLKTSQVQASRLIAARHLAAGFGVSCLLKGHETVVTDGHRVAINPTGNAGLAKGGTGDVLTGIVAGLWAQQLGSGKFDAGTGFEAAALGAYLHGLAADLAVKEKTVYSLLASDVIEALPAAFHKFL